MVGRIYPNKTRTRYSAQAVLDIQAAITGGASWRDVLIDALPEQERRVYDAMPTAAVTTKDVAAWEECTLNHASNILNQLMSYGLLERTAMTDESGLRYVYKVVR